LPSSTRRKPKARRRPTDASIHPDAAGRFRSAILGWLLHAATEPRRRINPEASGINGRACRSTNPSTRTDETMNTLDALEAQSLRDDIPSFRPGDTVKVHVRVIEGNRERVQVFEGVVLARNGGGIRETFTVRKMSFGVGVERTFPVHSPNIAKIEVAKRGDVRRAKLYYLRNLRGKAAKIKERREAPSAS